MTLIQATFTYGTWVKIRDDYLLFGGRVEDKEGNILYRLDSKGNKLNDS